MTIDANSILIDVNRFMLLVECEGKILKFIEIKKITKSMLFSILSNIIDKSFLDWKLYSL